jgi:NAD(P)-dependent dehydrogenase (short-subunit alcohol dehydrogenase family)
MDLGLKGVAVCISGGTKGMGRAAAVEFARAGARLVIFQMGIMSVVRCTRLAVPLMRKAGWGRVINVSSIAARNGSTGECGYMTMKAALNALSKNMALGLAKENIYVNSISPGLVITQAIEKMMVATGSPVNGYDPGDLESVSRWFVEVLGGRRMAGNIGRIGAPEEIAPWIVLLGSKKNTYLIGADIPIDGGTDYSPG